MNAEPADLTLAGGNQRDGEQEGIRGGCWVALGGVDWHTGYGVFYPC